MMLSRFEFLCTMLAGAAAQPGEWQPMFDGKSLAGWRETDFPGRGRVRVENGALVLGAGKPFTGVNYTPAFPRTDYEVRFEAARMEGSDFFASLTAPAGEGCFTWVTGGWGGDVVGISSIDGWDASENETRAYYQFENGRWYKFRMQVTDERITAWIDEEPIVNVKIAGRGVSLRPGEIEMSAPFGFAAYASTGALRKIEYRSIRRTAP